MAPRVADDILPFVSTLAKGLDIPIVLATVVDPESMEESAREEAEEALLRAAKRLTDAGLNAEVAASIGHPAEQILKTADEQGADLIAMSTHGRSPLVRGILGSVTDKVVHASRVPILTVTPERAKAYAETDGVALSKITVPLDGSDLAESALPYVKTLAKALSLEVVLARVITGGFYSPSAHYASVSDKHMAADIEQPTIDYLKGVAEPLRAEGLEVQWKLLRGHAAHAIVELTRQTPQDLVVLTSHGRSGIARWALGSVAEELVRSSGDPVLIIPAAE